MTDNQVGTRLKMSLVPCVAEHTAYFDAGPVVIGLEFRVLDDDVVASAYAGDAAVAAIFAEMQVTEFDDNGPSLHILDAGTRTEHLRFDMFDKQPHYHYIHSPAEHTAVSFDPHADGDMVEWALQRIERRLPEMLRYAGAPDLADAVDPGALAGAVAEARQAAAPLRRRQADRP
jgi:hypothetical protein